MHNGFDRLKSLHQENNAARRRLDGISPRFSRMAGRHENGTAPRAVSAYQLFQTPPDLARQLVESLCLTNSRPIRILEPSAGLGRLLDALGDGHEIVAVDIALDCTSELARQDRNNVQIYRGDFLCFSPHDLGGLFDAVVMNPPFHMRSDIRHIEHAITFLKPGGRLTAICMDTPHRATALRHLSRTWTPLPESAFKSEGTKVNTIHLTVKA